MKDLSKLPAAFALLLLQAATSVFIVSTSFAQSDTSTPAGRWYINTGSERLTWRFENQNGVYQGVRLNDQGAVSERFDNISWNPATRTLEFRRNGAGFWQWYRGKIVEGVLVARYVHSGVSATKPTDPFAYKWHATGWNYEYLTPAIAPQVYDLEIVQTGDRARLRIDRSRLPTSSYEGRLKFYARGNSLNERLEEDFAIERWDGVNLRFTVSNQVYEGVVSGRNITGTLRQAGSPLSYAWRGTRAEVLSYGFAGKTARDRLNWQTRTRNQLRHLVMAGNPAPVKREVTVLRDRLSPLLGTPHPKRDDNPNANPQDYTLTELSFRHLLPNPFGGATIERLSHAYLAKPNSKPRGGIRGQTQYPLVLAVNGHGGSAWQMMEPGSIFWYGDAFARQGYMVLAVDISHRPLKDLVYSGNTRADQLGYRSTYAAGDDEAHGNVLRPSIKPALPPGTTNPELYTDWEEDGERTWDVMRALDYALSRPDVDPTRIVVVGLSLGGEIATYVGALDPRITVTVPVGYSPDLSVLKFYGSHGCWNWHYADIREYIDDADLCALIAPRALLIETGKQDYVFSIYQPPFASDKQVARRVRAAYNDAPTQFIHYLHFENHYFRAGDYNAQIPEIWVRVPLRIAPAFPGDMAWQTDGATVSPQEWTVFRYIGNWLGFRYLR
jgi:dienelactone hydrolase